MWSFCGAGRRKFSPSKQADDTLLHHGQLQCHHTLHRSRRRAGYSLVSFFSCSFSHWLLGCYQHFAIVEMCATKMWWLEPEWGLLWSSRSKMWTSHKAVPQLLEGKSGIVLRPPLRRSARRGVWPHNDGRLWGCQSLPNSGCGDSHIQCGKKLGSLCWMLPAPVARRGRHRAAHGGICVGGRRIAVADRPTGAAGGGSSRPRARARRRSLAPTAGAAIVSGRQPRCSRCRPAPRALGGARVGVGGPACRGAPRR